MSLLLLPAGVRSVRAADGEQRLMSVDPSLLPTESAILEPPRLAPVSEVCEARVAVRPRPVATEVQARVIVLNTRGYNYDPVPSAPDPAALRLESKTRQEPVR